MKWFVVVTACLVASVSAGPLKDSANATLPVGKNETLVVPKKNVSEPLALHSRVRRDCGLEDLGKLQARITFAVEQEIEKLLKSNSFNRTRRAATSAGAGSIATPDGKIKSTASTNANSSGVAVSEPVPGPVQGGAPGAPDVPASQLKNGPVPVLQGAPIQEQGQGGSAGLPAGSSAPVPLPVAGSAGQPPVAEGGSPSVTVQKVKANANKEKGVAVASAVAKRAVHQELSAEGDKAISKAESHKGGDSHLQNIGAEGTHLGIASASIDGKNNLTKSGNNQDTTLQNVKATGEKAVATAAKKTDGGNTIQGALAEGDELSIASVSSGSEEHHLIGKRSVCLPDEINDSLRILIRSTIENAFADVKHRLKDWARMPRAIQSLFFNM